MTIRTLVVLRLQQSCTHALIAKGTATARDHDSVREEALANAADEVVRNLGLLLDRRWRRIGFSGGEN